MTLKIFVAISALLMACNQCVASAIGYAGGGSPQGLYQINHVRLSRQSPARCFLTRRCPNPFPFQNLPILPQRGYNACMKWRRSIAALILSGMLALPTVARAADDETFYHDARTEGYSVKVQVTKASVALVWLAFLFMSVVGMAAIFKDAKRTHWTDRPPFQPPLEMQDAGFFIPFQSQGDP